MGKTLNRDERRNSKFASRENGRKLKEKQQYGRLDNEKPPKPKSKWRPHSEIEVD